MKGETAPSLDDRYGTTPFTHAQALEAGIKLASDAIRFTPRNVAGLEDYQMRVVTDAALVALEAGSNGAEDIFKSIGATWLQAATK